MAAVEGSTAVARAAARSNPQERLREQRTKSVSGVVHPNMPILTNLRQDPFERMNWPGHGFSEGSIAYWDAFKHQMWRFQIPVP